MRSGTCRDKNRRNTGRDETRGLSRAGTAVGSRPGLRCRMLAPRACRWPSRNSDSAPIRINGCSSRRPQRPDGRVLLFWHGGGWTSGYKEWMAFMAPAFNAAGVTFVSAGYRLAPQHVFPAARRRLRPQAVEVGEAENIAAHGGDPNDLFIGGHSAGGHYAALLAVDDRWMKPTGLPRDVVRGCLRYRPCSNSATDRVSARGRVSSAPIRTTTRARVRACCCGGAIAAFPGRVRNARFSAPHRAGRAVRGGASGTRRRRRGTSARGPHAFHRELRRRRDGRPVGAQSACVHGAARPSPAVGMTTRQPRMVAMRDVTGAARRRLR